MNMRYVKHISITGLTVAVILYRESLRPVLLPLNINPQIIFSGIVLAIGYDIGLIFGWSYKWFGFKKIKDNEKLNKLLVPLFITLVLIISKFSMDSQQDFRSLLAVQSPPPNWFLIFAGSLTVAYLLLQTGQFIRSSAKYFAKVLKEPFPIVYTAVCILLATVGYSLLVISFFLLQTSIDVSTRPDIKNLNPPNSQLFSGSEQSQISWDGLGQKGQEFISTSSDIPQKLKDPIRIYAGVKNAADLEKRVQAVMDDFERTKAYDRSTIVLFTPSGSGWVNPKAVETVEKLTRGDSVSISLQYSNKQAVIQYIMDPQVAGRSSSLLFSKIRERLDKIDPAIRPKFYVYGESLGSLGSQEIFKNSPVDEITNKVDGIIWVGSPSSSPLWKRLSPNGDNSSVKITNNVKELQQQDANNSSKILFLYNTTDPIVRSNTEVIYKLPAWLKKPRSPQIEEGAHWLPMLTFGHLYFELYSATKYPSGIGHNYEEEIPCAFVYMMKTEAENLCNLN